MNVGERGAMGSIIRVTSDLLADPLSFLRKPRLNKAILAVFAQGILSLVSFYVSFMMARFGTKEQYGVFVILFSVLGIVNNYQGALITSPLVVLAPHRVPQERKLLIAGLGSLQWFLFGMAAVVGVIGAAIYSFLHRQPAVVEYAIVLSIATFALLLREFLRSINYSKGRMDLLVRADLLFAVVVGAILLFLALSDRIGSASSMAAIAVGYMAASLYALCYENPYGKFTWSSARAKLQETWRLSRWAAVGVTSNMIGGQGYIYLTSALMGVQQLAELSAARLLTGPVNLFVAGTNKIIVSQGAEILASKGTRKLKEYVLLFEGALVLMWLVYFFCLWVFYHHVAWILGPKYQHIGVFVFYWSLLCFVGLLRSPISNALLVFADFKAVAKYDMIGAAVTFPICLTLSLTLGGSGAIISLIAGEFAILALGFYRLIRLQPIQAEVIRERKGAVYITQQEEHRRNNMSRKDELTAEPEG